MGCSCGGRRGAIASTVMAGGTARVFRLYHANGATVDYWDEAAAQDAERAAPGSHYEPVDHRTGQPLT
ncbi:hypothetical protein ACFPC0_10930 [Streptomyces andamanensis]|uniref:Uncharacterized protein n=1 Tax=Streptomyces andamanensis TaxID=1565035 RepID=A0ABV8TCQ0_9ACTN